MLNFVAMLSALWTVIGFIFRSLIVKWAFYFALWFFVTEGIQYLSNANIFPSGASISNILNSFPDSIWWALDFMGFDLMFPKILGACVTAMILRMIPIFGAK